MAACLDGHPDVKMAFELGGKRILIESAPPEPSQLLDYRLERFRAACEAERATSDKPIFGNKITTEQIMGSLKSTIG